MVALPPLTPRLRGWSHLVAALTFPLLGLALVAVADGTRAKVATGVYAAGLTLVLLAGACFYVAVARTVA